MAEIFYYCFLNWRSSPWNSIFLEELGTSIHGKYLLWSWKSDVWASQCVFWEPNCGSLLVCFSHSWCEKRLKQNLDWNAWFTPWLFKIILVWKSYLWNGTIPGCGAGKKGVVEGLNSWVKHKSGTREQEYTEFSALAGIVIPWKLEQSLALVSEQLWLHGNCGEKLISCIAGAALWPPRKMRLFWVPLNWLLRLHSTPKRKESSGEKTL